jgi:hypothetical protein
MLETQTQIIRAEFDAMADAGPNFVVASSGAMMVCLCDQQPSDLILSNRQFGNWRLCKTHNNAVKLESMNGMNVMLYAADSKGDCVPIRSQPSNAELTAAAEEILSWVAFKQNDGNWWGHDTDCGDVTPKAVAILKRLLRGEA